MVQPSATKTAKVSTLITLFAAVVEVIAILILLWQGVLTDFVRTTPDAGTGVLLGFCAAMIPSLVVGFMSAAFARRPRHRWVVLHGLLAFAGFVALIYASI